MNKDRILGYAVQVACREVKFRYMNYNEPVPVAPFEITNLGDDYIRRLVGDGIRGAVARAQGDESRAQFARETVRKMRGVVKAEFESAVSADELFEIGYRAFRNDC